jgi:hypothetical protein
VVGAAIAATPAGAATFTNSTPISDPSGSGPASPYPSTISVSGQAGMITKARATLNDIFGGTAKDLDVLLVGPGGSTILMSDICSSGGTLPDLIHRTYTFDDDAAAPLPDTCSGPPSSGTYKPTNYDTSDNFQSVPPPYPVGLANVRGTSPNGLWQLYVFDDGYPDPWTIGGWSLDLTTTGPVAKKKCKKKHRRSAAAAKKKRCKKKRR